MRISADIGRKAFCQIVVEVVELLLDSVGTEETGQPVDVHDGVGILHIFACLLLRVHRRCEDDRGEQCGEESGSYQSAIHGASEGV